MEHKPRARLVPSVERATHGIAMWIEPALSDLDLTQAEAHVLAYLDVAGDSAINDLHHDFGHRRSTLTSVLDRLERRGLVRRKAHPASRRSIMLELTEDGHIAASRVSALLDELDATVRTVASTRDIEGFYRVLTAIEEAAHDRR